MHTHNENTSRQAFGLYVKKCRKAKKLSQQELGELLGLQTKSISCIERGITFPSPENIFKMARILDMSLDEYVYGYRTNSQIISVAEVNGLLESLPAEKKAFVIAVLKDMCEHLSDI